VTVGEALAEARYRAGLTVDEVSERTRIRETVIRCIEEDDYDACGGDLYVHGYVRAIAGAIGIDAQPLIREYDLGRAEAPGSADAAGAGAGPTATSVGPTATSADPAATSFDLPVVSADPAPTVDDLAVTAAGPWAGAADPWATPADPWAGAAGPAVTAAEHVKRPVKPSARQGRRRWVAGIGVLVILVVAGIAGGYIVASHSPASNAAAGQQANSGAGSQLGTGNVGNASSSAPAPSASAAPKAAKAPAAKKASRPATPVRIGPLAIARAEAFGPDGLADGDNPQSAAFAITRRSSLPWQSQWYATADFGLLKHGTGLLLDMGRRVTISSVRIYLGPYRGANLQLRVGNTATIDGLKTAARASDVGGTVGLRLREPVRARYLLIWFTLLPPNGAGQFQASVYRVVVYGRP
jgi:cytoskeletal protein RodZ